MGLTDGGPDRGTLMCPLLPCPTLAVSNTSWVRTDAGWRTASTGAANAARMLVCRTPTSAPLSPPDKARLRTPAAAIAVRTVVGVAPIAGGEASFSVRAELITDMPSDSHGNRVSARCTAVEYFGAVRRHIFEREDGEVLKYDQFGAQAARIAVGQTASLGWRMEDCVLHGKVHR